ncbi:hypothetical protein HDU98_007024 [Podochytrium sp. JEL0797]|nr:hypothetical protein HDU98_007024 [Podochytrium sp. JEL0797]
MPRIEELSDSDDDMPGLVDVAPPSKPRQQQPKKQQQPVSDSDSDDDMPGLVDVAPPSKPQQQKQRPQKKQQKPESDSDSDDSMPGLVDVQPTKQSAKDSDDEDSDSDDGMPGLVDVQPTKKTAKKSDVQDSDSDDDMPGLVDSQAPTSRSRNIADLDSDDDSDDDMPELVDLDPSKQQKSRYNEHTGDTSDEGDDYSPESQARSAAQPRFGQTSPLHDAAATCCEMVHLHVLGLCSSPLVLKLKNLIVERNVVVLENVDMNTKMIEAEKALNEMNLPEEEQKIEEEKVDKYWNESGALEVRLRKINIGIKTTDADLIREIKRSHNRLQMSYGRYKNGSLYEKAERQETINQDRRRYQGYNGRKGNMTESATANMLGLMEIDQASKILLNPKFRKSYLIIGRDAVFESKRRSPKYGDRTDPEAREQANAKQEPVWSVMRRQRTGGLQRYNSNPNRIQRVVLLEYPTQPTCPEITVNDTAEGRFVSLSWGVCLSEERAVDKCEVSMRSNGGLWDPKWTGDVNNCVLAVEEYGQLSFRIRAHNELGWGVYSYIREINNLAKWKLPVKTTHVSKKATKATTTGDTMTADIDTALTSLKEKISTLTSANPDLHSRLRVLTDLLSTLPVMTPHHQHLPVLSKHVVSAIQATEGAIQKQAKQVTNRWRIKLTALAAEVMKTPDESFSSGGVNKTDRSEFSDLLESHISGGGEVEGLELTAQSKNQVWQAVNGLYMKRPVRLVPTVVTSKKGGEGIVTVTPGLAQLRKIGRVLAVYVEGCDAGVFSGTMGVREWAQTVESAVKRGIEREEIKADEVVKAEEARVAAEVAEHVERERKEAVKVEVERKRRAAAEEKERLVIAERVAREERERKEEEVRREIVEAKAREVLVREKEVARQRALEEARVLRDEMVRRQREAERATIAEAQQQQQPRQQLPRQQQEQAPGIRVVRVAKNKTSTASFGYTNTNPNNNNIEVPADVPVSVERLDYGVNRVPKFGNHHMEQERQGNGAPASVEAPAATACRFFNTPRGCRNGNNCKNLHVAAEGVAGECVAAEQQLQPAGEASAGDNVCRFFNTKSGCRMGDKCRHAHVEGAQRPVASVKRASRGGFKPQLPKTAVV